MTDNVDTAATPSQAPQDDVKVTPSDTKVSASDDKVSVSDDKVTAKTDKTTIASDKAAAKSDDKVVPADDWRVRMAGGDEKELKRLGRYATEADVYKAYRELEKKKSSGELVTKLSKEPTAEELTQWRKENGIPETADKYELTFDNGLVIGDNDKPLIDQFVTKMHGENASTAQVKAAIASYYDIVAQQQQAMAEADVAFKDESLESLRGEWEGDFKKNLNAVNGLLQSMPEDVRSYFETARTADGKVLGNDPAVVKWLAATAFELNPAATVMPSSVNNPGAAISDEIAAINKMMGDYSSDYWTGPKDATGNTKLQVRYGELISAQEKIAARG